MPPFGGLKHYLLFALQCQQNWGFSACVKPAIRITGLSTANVAEM